jgi:hypothetical protein
MPKVNHTIVVAASLIPECEEVKIEAYDPSDLYAHLNDT